jgi:hypoxanthine phosphoribosyltransferase
MKKVYVSWTDVQRQTQEIIRQMYLDEWRPDYVVGITRGGLVPANLISQYLDLPMYALQVRLRDGNDNDCESNLWMAEDAFGYHCPAQDLAGVSDPALRKNILIVDDINDSGATINWIRQDWQKSCLPNDEHWAKIWGTNVRIATLYDNETSQAELYVNYSAETVNKHSDPQWIVFPWEEWWKKWHPNEEYVKP